MADGEIGSDLIINNEIGTMATAVGIHRPGITEIGTGIEIGIGIGSGIGSGIEINATEIVIVIAIGTGATGYTKTNEGTLHPVREVTLAGTVTACHRRLVTAILPATVRTDTRH